MWQGKVKLRGKYAEIVELSKKIQYGVCTLHTDSLEMLISI